MFNSIGARVTRLCKKTGNTLLDHSSANNGCQTVGKHRGLRTRSGQISASRQRSSLWLGAWNWRSCRVLEHANQCVILKSIQGLEHLTKLRSLGIDGSMELEELPSLGTMVFLEKLYAAECVKLKTIQGLEHLTKHQMLVINGCKELEELPSIERVASLEELCAFNYVKLKIIQGLARLTKLKKLDVRECSELKELQGLEHLMSLEVVLMSLEVVDVSGCPKLQLSGGVVEELSQRLREDFII